MSELLYKSYLFSTKEFMVLSALAGMEELKVFAEKESGNMGEEELNLTVFQLYQKGVLYWKDGGWNINPEVYSLLRNVKESERELQIYSGIGRGPLLCYGQDPLVILELSEHDKDAVRLHPQTRDGFFVELRDRGILPERDSAELEDLEDNERSGVRGKLLERLGELTRDGQIDYGNLKKLLQERWDLIACLFLFDRKEKNVRSVIAIADGGISDWLLCIRNGNVQAERYTMDGLRGVLKS